MTLILPSDLDVLRDTLLDATSELHDLLYGFQNLLSRYGSVCAFAVSLDFKFTPSTYFPYPLELRIFLPESSATSKTELS